MGRRGDQQPKKKLGQYASYAKDAAADGAFQAGESSKPGRKVIVLDYDSEDGHATLVLENANAGISLKNGGGNAESAGSRAKQVQGSAAADFESEDFVGFENSAEHDSDEEIDGILDEMDEVFAEGEKMMCDNVTTDPVQTKKNIKKGLRWLQQELISPTVSIKKGRGKEASKKQ